MFNILKFFGQNQIQKNISVIYNFAYELSIQEAMIVFNKNKQHCEIEYSKNYIENKTLSKEINDFFSTYEKVCCQNIIFSQELLKPYEYDEKFYIVGKYENLFLITTINHNHIFFEDDTEIYKTNDNE